MDQKNNLTHTQTNFIMSDGNNINNGTTEKTKPFQRKKIMENGTFVRKLWLKIHKKIIINIFI